MDEKGSFVGILSVVLVVAGTALAVYCSVAAMAADKIDVKIDLLSAAVLALALLGFGIYLGFTESEGNLMEKLEKVLNEKKDS